MPRAKPFQSMGAEKRMLTATGKSIRITAMERFHILPS
jgi:hypothetical protein